MRRAPLLVLFVLVFAGCAMVPQYHTDGSPKLDANGDQIVKMEFSLGETGKVVEAVAPFVPGLPGLILTFLPTILPFFVNKKKGAQ